MYAVISTGGKQYRLEQGDLLRVESVKGNVGDKIVFDQVLLLGDENRLVSGKPWIDGAQVIGKIVEHGKGSKVTVFKFKRRKMYRRRTGHRQLFTAVEIESITSGDKTEASSEKKTARSQRKPKDDGKVPAKKTPRTTKRKVEQTKKPDTSRESATKRRRRPAPGVKKKPAGKSAAKAETGKK